MNDICKIFLVVINLILIIATNSKLKNVGIKNYKVITIGFVIVLIALIIGMLNEN